MSRHSGPDLTVPEDDQRCQARTLGYPSAFWEWMRHPRRCSRRATQMRGQIAVCYSHAEAKNVEKWEDA